METLIKLILVGLLVLGLVGCQSTEQLEARISNLQHEVYNLQAELKKTKEGQDYYEAQAGVYRGCQWLVNICPESLLLNAEEGFKKGYGGGASWWYWIIIGIKFAALLLAAAVAYLVIVKWSLPDLEEGKRVQDMLHHADQELKSAEYRKSSLTQEIEELETRRNERLAQIEAEIKAEQAKLTRLKSSQADELAGLEAAKKALDLFGPG
jgi:uncharacterized protein YlxW (UPF0749 family)